MERRGILGHSGARATSFRGDVFLLICLVFSIAVNLGIHLFDNKYSHNGEIQPVLGYFLLNEAELEQGIYYLDKDWEFYRGLVEPRLISDIGFSNDTFTKAGVGEESLPEAYVSIGQYTGFELDDKQGKPYGSGTYRMSLLLPEKENQYVLELPEIFSAYKLFINGREMIKCGEPEPQHYKAELIQSQLTFSAAGKTELVFQVSNFSHYYSGIVYPPAFGTEQAMTKLLSGRTMIKSVQCFLAAILMAYYLALYFFSGREKGKLFFSMICLGYLGCGSYFLVHTLFNTDSFAVYGIENMSFMLLLLFLCELSHNLWKSAALQRSGKIIRYAGCFMLIFCGAFPLLISGSLKAALLYSFVLELYKVSVVIYLIARSVSAIRKGYRDGRIVLFALIFFGVSIFFDTFHRNYEPILMGRGGEYGGFVMLCVLTVMIFRESKRLKEENAGLETSRIKRDRYFEEVVHDLKAPLTTISTYAELARMGLSHEESKEDKYLEKIEKRAKELANQIQSLRNSNHQGLEDMETKAVDSLHFLKGLEERYGEVFAQKGIKLLVEGKSFPLYVNEERLNAAMENLLMNSIRFTEAGGQVKLIAELGEGYRQLVVQDNGQGIEEEALYAIFRRGVSLSGGSSEYEKGDSHSGLGLHIVKQVAEAHGGMVFAESEKNVGSRFALRFPL